VGLMCHIYIVYGGKGKWLIDKPKFRLVDIGGFEAKVMGKQLLCFWTRKFFSFSKGVHKHMAFFFFFLISTKFYKKGVKHLCIHRNKQNCPQCINIWLRPKPRSRGFLSSELVVQIGFPCVKSLHRSA
jgi:hypothetical protein